MAAAMERGQGSPLHRNMSAPPRMTLNVRTLKGSVDGVDAAHAGMLAGYAQAIRLDVPALCAHHFEALRLRNLRERVFPDTGCVVMEAPPEVRHRQLGYLVLLARLAQAPGVRIAPHEAALLGKCSDDALTDEFLDRAAALDPRALGLPAFAMAAYWPPGPGCELDPARAVAVLSRSPGRLFIAAGSPSVPAFEDDGQRSFALYVPEGGA